MRSFRTYSILLIVIALAFSCRKQKYPETVVENDAVFFVKGTVNGQPLGLFAGVDGYYMHTGHSADTSQLITFQGDLAPQGCTGCGPSFLFTLKNYRKGAGAFLLDSSFRKGPHPYEREDGNQYEVQFNHDFNRTPQSLEWDFGDGASSSLPHPLHVYASAGFYNVTLKITAKNGCISTIRNVIHVDEGALNASVILSATNGKTAVFSQTTTGTPPYSYLWTFGDGGANTQPNPVHFYAVAGSYPVTLRVTDGSGATAIAHYNFVTGGDSSSCAANYQSTILRGIPGTGLNEVQLVWSDDSGRKFSSSKATQPDGAYFEILDAEHWEQNEKGEPLVKMRARFKCNLSDGSTTVPAEGEITFATTRP